MDKLASILPRWIPAAAMMAVIFFFSSQSADALPDFLDWDYFVKKAGHAVGYGLLALSYHYALRFQDQHRHTAWLLALLYSATDEFHQSFTPGRFPSIVDVLVFDNLGAFTAVWVYSIFRRRIEKEN